MKKKKSLVILAFVLAVILIPVGAFAVKNAVQPSATVGGFVQKTVDRLNLTVDKTEFVFKRSADNTYNISFTFSAEKTEADFYGVINSLSIDKISGEYILFTAADGSPQYVINDTVLPASGGKTQPLSWTVEVPCSIQGTGTVNGSIRIEYTSGVTQQAADSHLLEIPLTVTIK